MKEVRMVAIDFDDTLCLTEEACFYLENYVAESMGHAPMKREAHKVNWGRPVEEAIEERVPGIDSAEFMRRLAETMPLFVAEGKFDTINPENIEILKRLKEAGKLLSVVTSRSLTEVEHLLEPTHELQVFLDGFYHKDRTVYQKPDPRVFDGMLQDFQLNPGEVVYIGDTPSDAKAATDAGMRFIAVLESGLRTEEDFQESQVDTFVQRFRDIEYLLLPRK